VRAKTPAAFSIVSLKLAGAFLPSDIFARHHRLCGNRVLKVSGSDAHGTPITIAADKQGVSLRQVPEQYRYKNEQHCLCTDRFVDFTRANRRGEEN
jgi:methionyl-tRNA synthetase